MVQEAASTKPTSSCKLVRNGVISAWLTHSGPRCFDYQWVEIVIGHTRPHNLLLLLEIWMSGAGTGHLEG